MVLLVVVEQEHAPLQDILKNYSNGASINVPHVRNGCSGVAAKCPLLQVLHSQLEKQVLLACKELEEVKVSVWPGVTDGRRLGAKQVLALLRVILEQSQTTLCNTFGCNLSEAAPGHTLADVGSLGLIVQAGGPDG